MSRWKWSGAAGIPSSREPESIQDLAWFLLNVLLVDLESRPSLEGLALGGLYFKTGDVLAGIKRRTLAETGQRLLLLAERIAGGPLGIADHVLGIALGNRLVR